MIVDAHTHPFLAEARADPTRWAAAQGEPHWGELVSRPLPSGRPLQDFADPERFLREAGEAGIDRIILQGWYWERGETCRLQNRETARWLAAAPEVFTGFASCHPGRDAAEALDVLEEARDLGLAGIGEAHPRLHGVPLTDDRWLAIGDFASRLDWPILFHVTEPVGRQHPGRIPTPPAELDAFIRTFPDLRVVLAHLGGLLLFHEANPAVRKAYGRVAYDLAALPLLYQPSILRAALTVVPAEKLIHGSDYPLRLNPRGREDASLRAGVEAVRGAGLTPEEWAVVAGGSFFWPGPEGRK